MDAMSRKLEFGSCNAPGAEAAIRRSIGAGLRQFNRHKVQINLPSNSLKTHDGHPRQSTHFFEGAGAQNKDRSSRFTKGFPCLTK
jgi:hypothetical protein